MFSKLNYKSQKPNSKINTVLFGICFFFIGFSSNAQCAMCRAALNGEENKVKAAAINDGIVYLMVIPYVLVGALGYYIYRMKKKKS
jgi:Na+/H+ antiporter NhaC